MAVVTKTLRSAGGDYTTMSAWEAGEQTDLVTAGDSHVLECYNDWSGDGLNDACEVNGWVTGASNFITIQAATGEDHGGVIDAGFRMYNSGSQVLTINQPYTEVRDIQVKKTGTSGFNKAYIASDDYTLTERCIFIGERSNVQPLELETSSTQTIRNCLVINTNGVTGDASRLDLRGEFVVENCTFIGLFQFTSFLTGTYTFRNNAFFGEVDDPGGTFSGTLSHNAFLSSGYTFGTNKVTGITLAGDLTDAANDDYTPATGGDLDGAGTDLSADFTDDITGATRTQWDIGAYGIAGGGSTTITGSGVVQNLMNQYSPQVASRLNGWLQ